jgi:hypothetical protein
MEISKPDIFVEQSSSFEETSFSISEADMGLVFDILRSKVYGNPIGSICREICSNARDANREVGKGNVPISVKMEKVLNSESHEYERDAVKSYTYNLTISDEGPGISPDRMKNVFLRYAASTKRNTNELTGGFGLGAKTPFSYTDKFSIETIVDGKKYLYVAVVDETQKGKILLLDERKTKKPNGTSIIIPIKIGDVSIFEDELIFYTLFWSVKPKFELTNRWDLSLGNLTDYPEFNFSILTNRNHLISKRVSNDQWICLIDEIPYLFSPPFEANETGHYSPPYLKVLKFKNSELDITVNRENLQFTEKTKSKLQDSQSLLMEEAYRILTDSLKSQNNYFEFLTAVETSVLHSNPDMNTIIVGNSEKEKLLYCCIKPYLDLVATSLSFNGKPFIQFDKMFEDFEVIRVMKDSKLSNSARTNVQSFKSIMGDSIFISSKMEYTSDLYDRYFFNGSSFYESVLGHRFVIISPKNNAVEHLKKIHKIFRLKEKLLTTDDKESLTERILSLQKNTYSYGYYSIRDLHRLMDRCSRFKRSLIYDLGLINLDTVQFEKKPRQKREKDHTIVKGLYFTSASNQQPYKVRLDLSKIENRDDLLFETYDKEIGPIQSKFASLCCSVIFNKSVYYVEEGSKKHSLISSIMNTPKEFLMNITPTEELKSIYHSAISEKLRSSNDYIDYLPTKLKEGVSKFTEYNRYSSYSSLFKKCIDELGIQGFTTKEIDELLEGQTLFLKQNPLITQLVHRSSPSKIRYYLELEKFKRKYAKQRKNQVHNN